MLFGHSHRRGATTLKPKSADPPGRWKIVWGPRLRWLGVALVLAAVGFSLHVGSQKLREPGAFPLRQVRIKGTLRNLAETDIRPIAHEYLGQNFFVANLDALYAALSANPWIEDVTVRRWWPDTIEVNLRERTAFGYWGEHEMVDVNGHRFRPPVLRQPGPWPRLKGPEGREKALIMAYQETSAQLGRVGLKLVKLVQDERRAWWLTFDNGLEVYLGREQFEQRLQRLVEIYPRILVAQVDRIAVLDLRYVNGFAVRWKAERPAPAAG
ncbi:MAG: cell division protein FtsQ/DivIB [Candidatus Competibacteraceae bacterium]